MRINSIKKKLVLFLILAAAIGLKAMGSSDTLSFYTGKFIFSIGYGFPNFDKWAFDNSFPFSNDKTYKSIGYGPFHFRAEYGLSDKIGIGVSLNHNTYGSTWTGNYPTPWTGGNFTTTVYGNAEKNYKIQLYSFTGLFRFNYHIFTAKKLDPYFAFGAGLKTKWKSSNSHRPKYINDYNINNEE